MPKTITRAAMLAVLAILLTACAKEPPKCSDDSTFALVRKIVLNQIGGGDGLSEQEIRDNMKIDFPRASSFDEKIKKYGCEAKLTVGGMYELPITYESQLDDKNEHIVVVAGIRRGDLLAMQAGMVEGIKKGRAAKGADNAPAAAPPTAAPSAAAPSVALPDLPRYAGKHPTDVFNEQLVVQKFKTLLGKDYDPFFESLSVAGDLELKGDYYFGSGCKPHVCTIEEAAFAIHKVTGEVLAVQLTNGKELFTFGVSSGSSLPGPLRDWYKEKGGPN